MTVILIITFAKYLPYIVLISLILSTALGTVAVGKLWWSLMRQVGFDLITIYGGLMAARDNAIKRRVEIEIWQQRARAELRDRRLTLQVGNAAMWKAGAYDVMVEDARH